MAEADCWLAKLTLSFPRKRESTLLNGRLPFVLDSRSAAAAVGNDKNEALER
jgi:hypothetical protein